MKRGPLAQFLALALLSTALVQVVSIDTAEAAFAATPVGLETVGIKDAGLAWADFNEDGCLDVIVTTDNVVAPDQYTQLYRSDCSLPNPTFVNVTATHAPGLATPPLAPIGVRRQVAWGDVNNDGHVDFISQDTTRLSVWINKGPAGVPPYGFGDAGGNPVVLFDMPDLVSGFNMEGGGLIDYDGDGDLDIIMENNDFGIDLWDNDGTGTFTWWTPNGDPNGVGLPEVAALGDYAAVTDFDVDGDVDFIARKEATVDLWVNTGGGAFAAGGFNVATLNANKGAVAFCDLDDDGLFDIIWTDHPNTQVYRQGPVGSFTATGVPVVPGGSDIDGAACGDADNDGDLDLFLTDTNGVDLLYPNTSTPGAISFAASTFAGGAGDGEGASFADYDNDGDLDILLSQSGAANQLWRNDAFQTGAVDYLSVRALHDLGGGLSRDALGATLQLYACDGVTALSGVREVNGGRGHGSQDPLAVHFGLPLGSDRAYIVQARFPTGETTQTAVVPSSIAGYRQTSVSNAAGDLSACQVRGTVFEDVDGNLLPGAEAVGDGTNPGRSGIDVRLYQDDGDGTPDGGDTLIDSAVTGAGGSYTLTAGMPVDYWVIADSRDMTPAAGGSGVAEQTYGPTGAWCADGLGGTSPARGSAGACYGGRDGDTVDNFDIATDAEHLAEVAGPNASAADFGFSFNVVTRSAYVNEQGTLERFVRNANTVTGANTMRFVPAVPTNQSGGGGDWWRITVGNGSAVSNAFPIITDDFTALDGTAHSLLDGTVLEGTAGDPNPGSTGYVGPVGTGADGVAGTGDELALNGVLKPELEIVNDRAVEATRGFYIQADDMTVRRLAIYGFGQDDLNDQLGEAFRVGQFGNGNTGFLFEDNIVGAGAGGFVDPGVGNRLTSSGFQMSESNGIIRDNLIGFSRKSAIRTWDFTPPGAGLPSVEIIGNEVRQAGITSDVYDGVDAVRSVGIHLIGNLITESGGDGFDTWTDVVTPGDNVVEDNTISFNGRNYFDDTAGSPEPHGMRLFGVDHIVRHNVIHDNYGSGVMVDDDASGIVINENSMFGNGDLVSGAAPPGAVTQKPGIDLIATGGDTEWGENHTGPAYPTLNDDGDGDSGGNDLQNYPVIDTATIVGADLVLTGWSAVGADVEFFIADPDPFGLGEGQTFITGQTEGLADGEGGLGSYTSPVNGIEQGDETNVPRFSFTVPLASLASPVVGGEQLTATGTVGGQTSEFGGRVTVASNLFSGTIFEDIVGDAVKDGGDPGRGAVDVRLYLDDGDGVPDGGDTLVDSAITAGDGSFSLIGGPGDHWVVVDSADVNPSAGGSGLAEQTFGPAGAVCTNGDSPETQTSRGTAGPCYGGRRGDVADNFAIGTDAEHVALANGATAGLDFGFSFNVVTRTNDTNTQGTLRRFLNNASTVTGANAMRFVPAVPTNASAGVHDWWRTDVGSSLPVIDGANTTIDGTAYDLADGATVVDPNNANLGATRAVGRTGAFTTPQLDPELEIHGTNTIPYGLDIQAGSVVVREISVWGFGDYLPAPVDAVIRVGVNAASSFSAPTIEQNVVGTPPTSFVDPGAGPRSGGHLIHVLGVDSGTVQNNILGFAGYNVIALESDAATWSILTNEIRSSGLSVGSGAERQGGVDIDGDSSGSVIRGNLIADTASDALENWESPGGFTVEHNTIENTGQRGVENMAIRVFGTGTVVENNVFDGGSGPAIIVVGANSSAPWPAATGNRLSQNEFRNNAGNSIDLMAASTVVSEYDDGDGITINDAATIGTSGNIGIDYPVIASALDGGASTTVAGTTCASCRVEIYEALAGAGDTLAGTDYGEGDRYLGFATADGSGNWSFVDATVGTTDILSAIAIDGGDNTSEFSANATVTAAATVSISGKVFEDIVGDVLNDGVINDASNPGVGNVTVRLYQDGGDGIPNGVDDGAPIASTTTDATPGATLGDYSFTGLAVGPTYWVIVDSKTVFPSAGVNSSPADDDDVWAEQTYGPAGSYDGVGYSGAAGSFYGGASGATADNAAGLATAEHVARFTATTSAANFGFSFNAVTNLESGDGTDADGGADRVFQGSLRQHLLNANAITGANTMRFVPAVPTNASDGGGHDWWSLPVTIELPTVFDVFTTLDGTAYDAADGAGLLNTNAQTLGYVGPVGTGADGVVGTLDEPTLSGLDAPEFELVGIAAVRWGIDVQADDAVVRRFAAYGFGPNPSVPDSGVVLDRGGDRLLVEQNVLGTSAGAFVDPGVATRSRGEPFKAQLGVDGIVRDNLVGYSHGTGIEIRPIDGWLIEGNEVRGNAITESHLDGISTRGANTTIQENLVVDNEGGGIDTWSSPGSWIVRNNTVAGNGTGIVNTLALADETYGIRAIGTGNTAEFNVVNGNYGPGILVVQAATASTISRNSIFGNGTILNLALTGPTGQIGIDLLDTGDDGGAGSSPYVTTNDPGDADGNANTLLNFPVLDEALIDGGNIILTGWARPNSAIEFFITDGSTFGEGQTYLATLTEGSGADTDTGPATLYSNPVNGLNQGTDTTNRFSFSIPTPTGVGLGTNLTATATDAAGNTSEFSGRATVAAAKNISGVVFEDIVGDVLNDGVVGDANNPGVVGATVRLYRDTNSNGLPDGADTLVATQVTGAGGAYTFSGLANGTYWVAADSTTVSPSAGLDASYTATTPRAEQTYGPDRGWCADGLGATAERAGAGPCYGGRNGAAADNAATLAGSEHISRAVVGALGVSNVDFGFSYNVVTNLQAAFAGSLDAASYQGSLDQFLRNANAIVGANAMRFVPAVPTNAAGGGGNWWQIDYTLTVAGQTPAMSHDADTIVDGTAYDLVDGAAVRDTNGNYLGANALGGVLVGVGDVPFPQVEKPELELMRSDSGIGAALPVDANAATSQTPDNFTVRSMAVSGWVRSVWMAGVPGFRPAGVTIEDNVLGSGPDTFADPGVPGTIHGLYVRSTDGGSLSNNLIGFVENDGAVLADVTGWAISGNEVREAAQVAPGSDGINDGAGSSGNTISGNLIVDSGGFGLDGTTTGDTITNNTITGSGILGVQTAGIRRTAGPNTISLNILTGNAGAGILVPTSDAGMRLTRNHFGGNGTIAIDLVASGGSDDSGDGVSVNDGLTPGTSGNIGLDYPVVTDAFDTGPSSTIVGTTCAGCRVEVYTAVADGDGSDTLAGTDYGEGTAYLGFATADGSGDWTYVDASLSTGSVVSVIAIDGANNTSEFSPNATVMPAQGISGVVFEDTIGDVLNDGVVGDALNPGAVGATVRLYRDTNTNGLPDGADTLVSTQVTGAGGAYSFTGLAAATYWVAVDSKTIAPAAGVNSSPADDDDVWAEQTYGPAGSYDGGFSGAAGPFYGGRAGTVADNAGSLATAEHVARATIAGAGVVNADFGFSFNVVTNLEAGDATDADLTADRVFQGSLRQFILNANAVAGANAMRFTPAIATNATDGSNNWWSLLVDSQLPRVDDGSTTIDGTSFDVADGSTVLDPNTAALGASVNPGLDGAYTTPTLDPELEIIGDRSGPPVRDGFDIRADDVTVRDLAIYGFGDPDAIIDADIHFWSALNGVVERSIVGGRAASASAPPVAERSHEAGVAAFTSSTVTVRDNIVHFADTGAQSATSSALTVTGNEITNNGFTGVTVGNTSAPALVEGNLLSSNGSFGSVWFSEPTTVRDNTIQNSSIGAFISGSDATGSLVTRNVITGNSGDGVYLSSTTANHIRISENHFGGNAGQAIDQLPVGVSINTGAPPACGYEIGAAGNDGLDFPIIGSAVDTGPITTLIGAGCANARIEIYRAVAGAGDTLAGTDYGEGTEFLGFTTADGSGNWTYVDASLNLGDVISTLAIDAANNTSEFSANATVVAFTVSGKVFEDTAGDVLNDGVINDANNPGAGNVTVYLYRDGGDGVPDGVDDGVPIASTTTDATPGVTLGDYSFGALPDGTYWVVADSKTVLPAAGVNSSPADDDDVWAEQTYAATGGYDGAGYLGAAGPLFGGKTGAGPDDASGLASAEHINRVVVSGGNVANSDFGFSFNVVTNLEAGDGNDADGGADRVFQGSLRQFILNANAVGGANAMRFTPAVPTNGTDGGGNTWWRVDTSLVLPLIDDAFTTVDGTAYDAADGTTVLDTNTAAVGSNLTVGVGGLFTTPLLDPELEIKGDDVILKGLELRPTADNSTLRNLAINRFQWWGIDLDGIAPDKLDSVTVENNLLGGTSPADMALDVASVMGTGVSGDDVANSTIRNNVIGYMTDTGIHLDYGSADNLVEVNEVRALNTGIYLKGSGAGQPARMTIRGNAFMEGGFWGIRTWNSFGDHVFTENTIQLGGPLGEGIELYGPNFSITRNIITGNGGDAISVDSSATGARISQNRFGNNGELAIDLFGLDDITVNDDVDGDPWLPNFPVIESAFVVGGNLTVTGFARPGDEVEFYEAIGSANDNNFDGDPHGEGVDYLFTAFEASVVAPVDADGSTGSYSTIGYGTDSAAERFSFTIPMPAGLAIGEEISAIAIDGSDNTSEFGPNVTVVAGQDITGTVFEDIAGDVLDDGVIGDGFNPAAANVTVRLYRDTGNGLPDATDIFVGSATTSAAGAYAFTGQPPGTYYVTVDSKTVVPAPGVNSSPADDDDVWAEQTYGPAGSYDGGFSVTAGAFYGGKTGNLADGPSSLLSAEHAARAMVAGAGVANLDFGFSFNVVTNLEAGDGTDADLTADRVFQGSLRQFILNANAVAGANTVRFTPAVPTNATDGGGNTWWRLDLTTALPVMDDAFTTIDGTVYAAADGSTVLDTNSQTLSYIGPVGAGPDGVAGTGDEPTLAGVAAPELEITGPQGFNGFELVAGADDFTLENTSMWGFDTVLYMSDVTRPSVRSNIIGSGPGAIADPGVGNRIWDSAIRPATSSDGLVENNFLGFAGGTLVSLDPGPAGSGWTVRRNLVRDGGTIRAIATVWDGVQLGDDTLVEENLIINSGAHGIDGFQSDGPAIIRENTITGNGHGNGTPRQTAGIRLYGQDHTVERNLITGNVGPGISITGAYALYPLITPAVQNRLSKNQFGGNGGIAIDLVASGVVEGDGEQGDGITLNDGGTDLTHGNIAIDYPVTTSATIVAGTTTVVGTVCGSCEVEVYRAVADGAFSDNTDPIGGTGADHGEGVEYLGTALADGAGNWSLVTTAPISGDFVSAIAIDAVDNTSEFAPNVVVGVPALSVTKVDSLIGDLNLNGKVDPGDTVRYVVTMTNTGTGLLTGITFTDLLADPEITLYTGSLVISQGTVITGDTPGDTTVVVDVGSLAPGASATVRFHVQASTVAAPYVASISNQGTVASDQLPDTVTDDPADATSSSDPTVVALNHIPSLVNDGLAVDEDSGPTAVAAPGVLGNDTVHDGVDTVAITSGPSNGVANIAVDGSFDYTPNGDYFGADSFVYEVCDTDGDCRTATVNISVASVNDEPSFVSGGNVVVLEDSGAYSAPWAGSISVGPANESAQTGTFNITANTNAALFSALPAVDGSGGLTFTPAADANGFADITIELQDNGGVLNGGDDTSTSVVFRITVTAVNDEPGFVSGGDVGVLEDSGAYSSPWAGSISMGPVNESGQSGSFNVTGNTNAALFSALPAVDATGVLTFTPAADANGTADITIEFQDDGGVLNGGDDTSASVVFTVTVTPVNDEPSFTKGADDGVLEDSGVRVVAGWATGLSTGPADEAGQSLTFNVTGNTNPGLFSVAPSVNGATGDLSYTPAADGNGTATITLEVQDDGGVLNGGDDTSLTQSFVITVTPVNDEPSFTKGADDGVLEDSGARVVAGWATGLSAGPADESGQSLTFNVTGNTNPGLFSAAPSVNGATGDLSYTPAVDANGTATITIEVQDDGGVLNGGDDTSPTQSFTITVTPVNDEPSFVAGPDVVVLEDSGAYSAPWAGSISMGPADESGQIGTFNITANTNPGLFSAAPAVDGSGGLTFTPAADANGFADITIELQDNGGVLNGGDDTSPAITFRITVTDANDPPVAVDDSGPAFNTAEDTAFTTGDVLGNDSDVDGVLDASTIAVDTTGTVGVVVNNLDGMFGFTPSPGWFGTTSFDYRVQDDDGDWSNWATVSINVSDVNDPPTAVDDAGAGFGTLEDTGFATGDVLVNDSDSDGVLVPATIEVDTTGTQGVVVNNLDGTFGFTPTGDFNGSTTFDYRVQDDDAAWSGWATVTVDVTAVNDEPGFVSGGDVGVLEDSGAYSSPWAGSISMGPVNESGQSGSFNVTGNTNAALFSALPAVDATGVLTFTPAADANGTADITIEFQDDGGVLNGGDDTSASVVFTVTVTPVNDEPSFTKGADDGVLEDSGVRVVAGWATGLSTGPADEAGQSLTFNVTGNTNPGLFSAAPSVNGATGDLSYTPAADGNGTATITLEVQDDGGVLNGGDDTSLTQSFVITVTPVNDEPSFTKGADDGVLEDSGARVVAGWATGLSAGPADESGQSLTFNVTGNTNPGLFSAAPSVNGATGDLSYTPAVDANGTATITIEVQDDGGVLNGGDDTSPTQSFTITVTPVNDEPSFVAGPDVVVLEDSGAYSAPWAGSISMGPADESGQIGTFNITANTNPGLFSAAPAVDGSGGLTFTPAADANGFADITIELQDNGGVLNGGDDTSPAITFRITVTDANDPPVAVDITVPVNESDPAGTILGTVPVVDIDLPPDTLTWSILSGNTDAAFDIDPLTGEVFVVDNTPLNYEVTPSYDLVVEVSDGNGGTDTATVTVNVFGARLATTLSDALLVDADGDLAPSAGDTLQYTATITNSGIGSAFGVLFSDLITDPSLDFIPATVVPSQGAVLVGGLPTHTNVVVDVGTIVAADVITIGYDVAIEPSLLPGTTLVATQGVVSVAGVGAHLTDDPDTASPLDPTATPVAPAPSLTATKTAALAVDADGDSIVSPGDTLHYTVTVTNDGDAHAGAVVTRDGVLDGNMTLVAGTVTSSFGTVTGGNGVGDTSVEVNVGTLMGAGGAVVVEFDALLASAFPAGVGVVSNQGSISADNAVTVLTDDPSVPGPADPTLVPVAATPDVTAGKDDFLLVDGDGDGVAAPGDIIRYTVVITNSGSLEATGLLFADDLADPLVTLVAGSATTSAGTITSGNEPGATAVGVDVGSVAGAGGTVTIAFDAAIADSVPNGTASVSNVGLVGAMPTEDPVGGGPTITPLEVGPDLVVSKTDSGVGAGPGAALVYTISYWNRGTEDAAGVLLTETVPAHTSFNAAASGGGWSCANGAPAGTTCTLALGSVLTGTGAAALFAVTVDGSIPAGTLALSNTVSIAEGGSGSPDIDPTNNTFTLATSLGEAVITGRVWVDRNDDGSFDAGEPPLAGVGVELTHVASATVTAGAAAADGSFSFGGLAAGDFIIDVVEGTVPVGIVPAIPAVSLVSSGPGDAVDSGVITVASGSVWRADFPHIGAGSIAGTVWNDLDGDGVLDAGEPGLGGVTVSAALVDYTWVSVSDPAGDYRFEGLAPDTYTVDVVTGGPVNGAVTGGGLPITVALAPGIDLDSLDIGYHDMADMALGVNLYDAPNRGEPITYIFTVSNNGPASSGPVTLTALLPGGFDYTLAAGTGWTCTVPGQLVCTGAPMASGTSTTVAVTGTVAASEGVTLTILGAISSTTPDDDLSNNQAALSAGVGQLPQTGINADTVGLYGLLLLLAGGFLLLWAVLADRRHREEEEPFGT